MPVGEQEVLFRTGRQDETLPGSVGVAILNRPKALNALNEPMCKTLHRLYDDWDASPDVHAILVKGAGGKAFCAGGDVKGMVQYILAGQHDKAISFFREEYRLNHRLGTLQTPHIALIDGIVMGGGAGISVHGAYRVATERTVFAMPECGIGLFPDVGASYFLPRLPGQLGTYLGLTGRRLKGIEVKEAQLATHYVASERLPALEEMLHAMDPQSQSPEQIRRSLQTFEDEGEPPEPSGLLDQMPAINECFDFDSLQEIYAALERRDDAWSRETLDTLHKSSKLSQVVVLLELREGAGKSLAECLRMEFRMVHQCVTGKSDFIEGVRALLIDKTGKPQWDPSSIEQVTKEMVDRFFEPLPPGEELHLEQQGVERLNAANSKL
ncbi:ClpP/crotonase [Coccomyxa subellipsoidea C-169]|uniref:3-hydroxyisobutyryl-CoA hydrolase n=1 Tax=Coccomyxa subellipsoidea (strain C-169) TaxID=574566 RepID=I0YU60_COCSC|nr:ClpP/crotonase [Coccomyxa subellipsoidea C-169]EIE21929.1 ClpP/crotonase [Coccomyxa subellipsoidea C-169]|eukprot:XP_005646473.1 ClpP/crotonase [Coccomyxa subellipsoidea C-169]